MAVPIPKLTPEEYLEIERKAEYKSEYFNGEMFAMAGGAPNHHRLAFRMNGLLFKLLDGRDCEAFTSDAKVRTHPRGLYTYPDLTVVCGKATFAADQRDVLTNPKVIFELLSPSTEAHDRGLKFQQYKLIDSLQEFVLISQFEPLVESFYRSPGGAWGDYSEFMGLDAVLKLKSIDIEIPLADIYRNIDLTADLL